MTRVHRFEVRPLTTAGDPAGDIALRDARRIGFRPESVRSTRVYLVEAELTEMQRETLLNTLLVDPVLESGIEGASPVGSGCSLVEIHPLPGVMDPAAQSVTEAIETLLGVQARVSTGWRYEFRGLTSEQARDLARRVLANPVIHAIHESPFHPDELPAGHEPEFEIRHIALRDLDDEALAKLSREAHLFLSLDEMRCIRDEYRRLGREPTDIELETFAQTWSEHCVHKTLKSTINYQDRSEREQDTSGLKFDGRPGHTVNDDGSVTIRNLLKSTVAVATHELIAEGLDWTLSVFVDNAGIIAFDEDHAVCVKVETHNHPSAIEPYGGAATGIGGCIRDIIGTGLAAKPIASTDVFCVAPPEFESVPDGCLKPRRILTEVVAGVRDYGNRMGIPTVNGAVWFDERHVGNPLVFCGCVGIMPRDLIGGQAKPGDLIVALGGRTGRDGIHGATFSSAELTDTHTDEFAHAVQIGNAIEEKRVLDAIVRARDDASGPLFSAITDCGAGGFSSAVGEMGEKVGAEVHLDRAPLKYAGLTYTEIWISEAQERMVLAVPPDRLDALDRICREEKVELSVLGTFGTPNRELILNYRSQEVGRLSMHLLHEGIPTPTRTATWHGPKVEHNPKRLEPASADDALLSLLAHPNIASKHWIIRQYDHEVQGNTVIPPLCGPNGRGPMDASVIEPVSGSTRGLAIGCGLATGLEADPYLMALAAIDECVRNLVCVGTDPQRIAILDNFCWPSCNNPENLGSLVRAAEGCYDGAKAYRTPFVSGKDSLNNQFTTKQGQTIEIPPTLLITGIGIVSDTNACVTMDIKSSQSVLVRVAPKQSLDLAGSTHSRLFGGKSVPSALPVQAGVVCAQAVAEAVRQGLVLSAHDISDGGLACTVAEMLIAARQCDKSAGATLNMQGHDERSLFGEGIGNYVLEVACDKVDSLRSIVERFDAERVIVDILGATNADGILMLGDQSPGLAVADLEHAWRGTLDWASAGH